jgi:hypothetical protein
MAAGLSGNSRSRDYRVSPVLFEGECNQTAWPRRFEKSIAALQAQRRRLWNAAALESRLQSGRLNCPVRKPSWRGLQGGAEPKFGIVFNKLFTITNQPIARFAEDLRQHGKWDEYLELLATSFNPVTVDALMCRTTLSVGYRGEIYDCDFNQMLGLQLRDGPLFLWDITPQHLESNEIMTGAHCLAYAAGCGSSCTGALRTKKLA